MLEGGRDRAEVERRIELVTKIFSPLRLWEGKVLGTEKAVSLQRKESAFSIVHNKRKLSIIHKQDKQRESNRKKILERINGKSDNNNIILMLIYVMLIFNTNYCLI